jgi:hypothetical protein
VRTDPTDTGGLFVRRRPGTAPVRYRDLPDEGTARRRRADAVLAHALLALMVVVNLLFWGPLPAASLWLASRTQYLTDNLGIGLLVGFGALVAALLGGLVVLKRLDQSWVLVRRAAGVDQRSGALPRVFGTTAVVAAVGFTGWLVFIGGLGSSMFTGQG